MKAPAAVVLACLAGVARGAPLPRPLENAGHTKLVVVHVLVALCDNDFQGIVPVPARLGNGRDPDNNLYWGARFGVRTYMGSAPGWRRRPYLGSRPPGVLERAAFSTEIGTSRVLMVADAWEGSRIRETIGQFLEMASGRAEEKIAVDGVDVTAGGLSRVVVFLGHNGLMDFSPPTLAPGRSEPPRAAVVLACSSRPYFAELLARAGAQPVLLTTGLMAPEAYSLEAAIKAWVAAPEPGVAASAAAKAYDRYQRCGISGARRLFGAPPQ